MQLPQNNKEAPKNLSICVFCASSDHVDEIYTRTVKKLGSAMVSQNMTLIYGGGNNGLMGALSESVHENNGRVIGVITREFKDIGYAYEGTDEMIVTEGMRERKAVMEDLADGFIGFPGGYGTLEELLEIITLKQLRLHDKPIVILNINGFFDNLLRQFETGFSEHFISKKFRSLFHVSDDVDETLEYIRSYCGS